MEVIYGVGRVEVTYGVGRVEVTYGVGREVTIPLDGQRCPGEQALGR